MSDLADPLLSRWQGRRLCAWVAAALLCAGLVAWTALALVPLLAGEPPRNGNPPLPTDVLDVLDAATEVELRAVDLFRIEGLEPVAFGEHEFQCHPARRLTTDEWAELHPLLLEGLAAREGHDNMIIAALCHGHLLRVTAGERSVQLRLQLPVERLSYLAPGLGPHGGDLGGSRNTSVRALERVMDLAPHPPAIAPAR